VKLIIVTFDRLQDNLGVKNIRNNVVLKFVILISKSNYSDFDRLRDNLSQKYTE